MNTKRLVLDPFRGEGSPRGLLRARKYWLSLRPRWPLFQPALAKSLAQVHMHLGWDHILEGELDSADSPLPGLSLSSSLPHCRPILTSPVLHRSASPDVSYEDPLS